MEEKLTMEDLDNDINNSFKELKEGDILKVTVIAISDTEVTVDLNYYVEGVIPIDELSNNPQFSIKADIAVGDEVSAMVLAERGENDQVILSKKKADDIIAWDILKENYKNEKVFEVKISQTTNGGVLTYLEGIRAFIPASQLSTEYVENLNEWLGKKVKVKIITVEPNNKKLVLSAKELIREKKEQDKLYKISSISKGTIFTGTIETVMPYGVFVNIGDGLSGLVHISQICEKHIKSPNEVVKQGQEVKVKVINVKDGKISLSIKAVSDDDTLVENESDAPVEYISGENATTSLGSLLAGLKFD